MPQHQHQTSLLDSILAKLHLLNNDRETNNKEHLVDRYEKEIVADLRAIADEMEQHRNRFPQVVQRGVASGGIAYKVIGY